MFLGSNLWAEQQEQDNREICVQLHYHKLGKRMDLRFYNSLARAVFLVMWRYFQLEYIACMAANRQLLAHQVLKCEVQNVCQVQWLVLYICKICL